MSTRVKRAFVTGAYGQDGSYLCELLVSLGYEVLGLVRDAEENTHVKHILSHNTNFHELVGDLSDHNSYIEALRTFMPDEVYNLAAVSDLKTARENPVLTMTLNFHAVRELTDSMCTINPQVRMFQALSSRILEPHTNGVIDESSPLLAPSNPYDDAKRRTYEEIVLPYRKAGVFIASGFLCNHESPRRGPRFVTGKIAKAVVDIKNGTQTTLSLGNMAAQRDWSFAGDFVIAMHKVLQHPYADDYVFGSGTLHSVEEFVTCAFKAVHIDLTWDGEGLSRCAYDTQGILRVETVPEYYQSDDNAVVSDTTKLRTQVGWVPQVTFEELVCMMVRFEEEELTSSQ